MKKIPIQQYQKEEEIDLRVFLHFLIKLLIKHKIIILIITLIVSLLGFFYSYFVIPEDIPKYEVNYFIQNGIRRFEGDEVILSINIETLEEWLGSRAYQFSRYFRSFDKHYEITAEIPPNTELIKFITFTSDTDMPIDYFDKLVETIENQSLFLQRIEMERQLIKQLIKSIERQIEMEKIKLITEENRIKTLKNDIKMLNNNIDINEYKINQITALIESYEQLIPHPERERIRRAMPTEKTNLLRQNIMESIEMQAKINSYHNEIKNLEFENHNYEKNINEKEIKIEQLNRSVLREIKLNIELLEEEIEMHKIKLSSIRLLNKIDDPMVYLPNKNIDKKTNRNRIIFVIIGIILGFIGAYIKEVSNSLTKK